MNRDPRIRALVDAARAAHPTAADRARVRAALAARLVLPAPHGGAAPSPPAAPLAASVGMKLLAAGALIGAAGFGSGLLVGLRVSTRSAAGDLARHGIEVHALERAHGAEHRTEGAPPAPPAPALAAERAPLAARSPDALALPRRPATSPPSVPLAVEPPPPATAAAAEPTSPEASSLLEETELLRAAQTSLGAGDARAALARLDDLGARHADGILREERLAAHIVALCAVGRDQDARREAARFLAEAPLSIHAARVRGSCGGAPGGK